MAPLPMGFSRQEYWSGLPCLPPGTLPNPGTKPTSVMPPASPPGKPSGVGHSLPPGDLPDAGVEPRSPELQADSLLSEPPRKPIPYSILM